MAIEKIIEGCNLTDKNIQEDFEGKNDFCSFYSFVRKGHHECGDSAAMHVDDKKALFAVFDGVSGASNASLASSTAANEVIGFLKNMEQIYEDQITTSFVNANKKIRSGATTAVFLLLEKSGKFIVASIGDSPIYSISETGKNKLSAKMLLPLDRLVADGNSIMKFFAYRNVVTAVLGSNVDLDIHFYQGQLKSKDLLLLVSDGISDNLFVNINEGDVVNSSGEADLETMLKNQLGNPKTISKKIVSNILDRIAHFEQNGHLEFDPKKKLVPKQDDISIIAIRFDTEAKS